MIPSTQFGESAAHGTAFVPEVMSWNDVGTCEANAYNRGFGFPFAWLVTWFTMPMIPAKAGADAEVPEAMKRLPRC